MVLNIYSLYSDDDKAAAKAIRISLAMNAAAACLKTGDSGEAVKNCDKALEALTDDEADKANMVKTLFRKGQGLLAKGEYKDAKATLKQAYTLGAPSAVLDLVAAQAAVASSIAAILRLAQPRMCFSPSRLPLTVPVGASQTRKTSRSSRS